MIPLFTKKFTYLLITGHYLMIAKEQTRSYYNFKPSSIEKESQCEKEVYLVSLSEHIGKPYNHKYLCGF